MDPEFHKFMDHVDDLEEWNEEWDHEFLAPTIICSNVVTVIHPIRERPVEVAFPDEDEHTSTVVATYKPDGTPIALQVYGRGEHDDTNYWRRPYQDRLPDLVDAEVILGWNEAGKIVDAQVNATVMGSSPKKRVWMLIHKPTFRISTVRPETDGS